MRYDIEYARPLYYISLLTGLVCPIDFAKPRARLNILHVVYSIAKIAAILTLALICFFGRARAVYPTIIDTLIATESIHQLLLVTASVYGIANQILVYRTNLNKYFITLGRIDESEISAASRRRYFERLFWSHQLSYAVLFAFDGWCWVNTMGIEAWGYYGMRLYNYYMIMIVILQIHTYVAAIKLQFRNINDDFGRILKAPYSFDLNRATINHGALCDAIVILNDVHGFNILLLVCCIIFTAVWNLNLAIVMKTGLQKLPEYIDLTYPSICNITWVIWIVILGVETIWICSSTSKEGKRTGTIAYKLLCDLPFEETELQSLLRTLVQQIDLRRPGFNAAGFFPVDASLLSLILGAISSYLIIVTQLNASPIVRSPEAFQT